MSEHNCRLVLYRRNEDLAPASAGEHLYHDDYRKMYVDEISASTSLEDIYTRFNEDRPEDFREEPLAVGDIIVIEQEPLTVDPHSRHHEGNPWAPPADISATAHYVCAVGFKEKPEFAEAHIRGELLQFCEREHYYGHIDRLGRFHNGCVDVVETGFFKDKEAYGTERDQLRENGEPFRCSRFGGAGRMDSNRDEPQPQQIHSARISAAEGRVPNHDGEYLTMYYIPGETSYVIVNDKGITWTSSRENDAKAEYAAADQEHEFNRIMTEVKDAINRNTGEPVTGMGLAALAMAIDNQNPWKLNREARIKFHREGGYYGYIDYLHHYGSVESRGIGETQFFRHKASYETELKRRLELRLPVVGNIFQRQNEIDRDAR